ncbi:MAG: AAC(3) family N-acetyltransferase [Bacteroidota bacterium]
MKKFSQDEIKQILENKLGVKKGATVFIHSSMNQIQLDFPLHKIISILKEVIGDEGTLLFPCWQDINNLEEYIKGEKCFDVKRTISNLGILPELVRRDKQAQRSWSPTNSVVALGKLSKELTFEHHLDIYPCGEKSPFYKLVKNDAIIIGIGVSTRYLSFSHCIEDVKKDKFPFITRTSEIFTFNVKTSDGEIIKVQTKMAHPDIKNRDVPKYIKTHVPKDIALDMKIHNTSFFYAKAKDLFETMEKLTEQGITIYNY